MTDRLEEIERRLSNSRRPCPEFGPQFEEWLWDQRKFCLHAEDDVAFLLGEVRGLRRQLADMTRQAREIANDGYEAQSLALSLADALDDAKEWIGECYRAFLPEWMLSAMHNDDDDSRMGFINQVLSDERLTKLREMKNV